LPNFIGELKNLQCLIVADNMLSYYPSSLIYTKLNEVDISNNIFKLPESRYFNSTFSYMDVFGSLKRPDNLFVKPLSHLSLSSLIDNCVPFKRQDIPRTLWLFFDVVGRCLLCKKCILPDYSHIGYYHSIPRAIILIRNNVPHSIPNQFLVCHISCQGRYS